MGDRVRPVAWAAQVKSHWAAILVWPEDERGKPFADSVEELQQRQLSAPHLAQNAGEVRDVDLASFKSWSNNFFPEAQIPITIRDLPNPILSHRRQLMLIEGATPLDKIFPSLGAALQNLSSELVSLGKF